MTARNKKTLYRVPGAVDEPRRRPARIAEVIRHNVALMLHGTISDPRLISVTITDVTVSADMRTARIFYDCRRESQADVAKGLVSARGFIRSALARELGIRYMPELTFVHDETLDRQEEITRLLQEDEDIS